MRIRADKIKIWIKVHFAIRGSRLNKYRKKKRKKSCWYQWGYFIHLTLKDFTGWSMKKVDHCSMVSLCIFCDDEQIGSGLMQQPCIPFAEEHLICRSYFQKLVYFYNLLHQWNKHLEKKFSRCCLHIELGVKWYSSVE